MGMRRRNPGKEEIEKNRCRFGKTSNWKEKPVPKE